MTMQDHRDHKTAIMPEENFSCSAWIPFLPNSEMLFQT